VLIRLLTARAALARALAVGDTERILEVATRELARKTDGLARAPLLLARAFAFEISGDWPKVIGALDEISLTTPLSPRAQALQHETAARRAGALVELGQVATARAAVDTLPAPTPLAPNAIDQMVAQLTHTLARGRVLVAEGKPDEARRALEAITKNIRATELQRATAHYYLAAISGEAAAATHRLAVARFAPRSWMNQNRPA
ncbi:MAG: hypothetical protein NT062_01920, partial [Proteobacteria bacterium]|nr:hypothetical protein [Pseudomonadota bacterium]